MSLCVCVEGCQLVGGGGVKPPPNLSIHSTQLMSARHRARLLTCSFKINFSKDATSTL